ncbi:MAG TPA: DUF4058 family protein [Chloroflexaceae bacterium]|nr:DUF4058 family protein [Chloroflexaceae bacterium]
MGSPFPGMDPYLEGDLWQEFHGRLANAISAQLMPKIAPKYVAMLARRFVITRPTIGISYETGGRVFYPDVGMQHIGETTASYAAPPDTVIEAGDVEEVPVVSLEIRDVRNRSLVTAIEILSPSNKFEPGYSEYMAKRTYLLQTSTNVMEIDLLRRGERVALARPLPPAPYYVILNRHERRANEVWTLPLRERLKTVPVPLLPNDHDVALDLQAAVEACFALVGYERLLPYDEPPPLPELSADDAAWLDARLRAAGYRSG